LLLIGLSQIPIAMACVVIAWLMALGYRQKQSYADVNTFNLVQILLIALTLASLAILFIAVEQGLLGSPDMQIAGNQSTAFKLNWYQDRSPSVLPTASVVSLPLMSYRIMMLIWSLWLAISLLNWLKWGWECFSNDALWKKSEPKAKKKEPPL
jgi:small-conductance mechanosensitive channel